MDTEIITLSDLYKEDVQEGSIIITQKPTSLTVYADNVTPDRFFMNERYYNKFDHFEIGDSSVYTILLPHRGAAVVGSYLHLYCERKPSTELSQHWVKKLGEKVAWRWGIPGQDHKPHIVLWPMEKLRPELHSVDPDKFYQITSKLFIPEIQCPQARVFDPENPEFPCVVKPALGGSSEGTFMVYSEDEYLEVRAHIAITEPDSDVIVCEMIQDIIANYCCQFYLNKKGEMRWLGVTEQFMGENGFWLGAFVRNEMQASLEELLRPTLLPVAQKLHEWTYFGLVGVDVLLSKDGSQKVIDINPRINGSTPLLLASRMLASRGWTDGIFIVGVTYKGSLVELINSVESVTKGEIVIFSATEKIEKVICCIGVFSSGLDKCRQLYDSLFPETCPRMPHCL